MAAEEQKTITLPGKPVSMAVRGSLPMTSRVPVTSGTSLCTFDAVKNLLSDKPLRRPNRTRPIDAPASS